MKHNGGVAKLPALASLLSLIACIPGGGDGYTLGRNMEIATPSEPQIVPERAVVAETPSWSPAVVERNARRVATSSYTVKPGDSLFAIANRTGAGATAIADANSLTPPYAMRTGDRLQIPGGLYHRVGKGETGIAIARAYAVAWSDVIALNALPPPYTLQLGQNLLLPAKALPDARIAELTAEQRAAAFSLNIDDIVTGGRPAGTAPVMRAVAPGFAGRFAWPFRGKIVGRFGSLGGGRVNDGLNIASPSGTPVGAAAPGTVVYSGNEIGVFGGLVLVDHGGGWVTAYGHLGSLNVAEGDRVATGQALGGVGETGYVTQPQLHFEIRKDRKPLNPVVHLPST